MSRDADRIPMRELERLTGFTRATILYYIKEGLLPEPEKTARNMAYYDRRFVVRLNLIRRLKEQHNLSLQQIKHVMQASTQGMDPGLMMAVRDRIFHRIVADADHPPVTRDKLLTETGLDEAALHQLAWPP